MIVEATQTTIKPNYAIWLWNNGRGEMMFSIIENMNIYSAKKFYEYHQLINGKNANVWVFFNDYDIHRNDCIAAATRLMRGDYVRIDVDLYNGHVITTKGWNRIKNPPL